MLITDLGRYNAGYLDMRGTYVCASGKSDLGFKEQKTSVVSVSDCCLLWCFDLGSSHG
jgi:hypothetical protein